MGIKLPVSKLPFKALKHSSVSAAIREAAIVLGVDINTGKYLVFYGQELLEEFHAGRHAQPPPSVAFDLNAEDQDQVAELAFTVFFLKGSCCVPGADEQFSGVLANHPVRVLDPASGQLASIPARELAPGMIQALSPETGEPVWIEAAALSMGGVRHPPLAPELREQLKELKFGFSEVPHQP